MLETIGSYKNFQPTLIIRSKNGEIKAVINCDKGKDWKYKISNVLLKPMEFKRLEMKG